jgi:hypothetical protein
MMTQARLEDLVQALLDAAGEGQVLKSTSVRLPEPLHRAAQLAAALGMDESFSAVVTHAVDERIRAFARRSALADLFAASPEHAPSLAAVAHRRVHGGDHPAVRRPELVDEAAAWVERKTPEWLTTGAVDDAVDQVLDFVEMLDAGVGGRQPAVT